MLKDAAFLLLVLVALLSSCTSTSTIQYDFDKPVHGQTTLQEKSGMIYITVKFPPTNKFGKQMSRKMDRNTAEDLLNETLRRYFHVESETLHYSNLQQTKPPVYEPKIVEFNYSLPRNSIVIK